MPSGAILKRWKQALLAAARSQVEQCRDASEKDEEAMKWRLAEAEEIESRLGGD